MRRFVTLVSIAGAVACHHIPAATSASAAPCVSPYPPPAAGTVRIDGPGAFGPHVKDSLIVRVDNEDRWSGILRSCKREAPGLHIDFSRWQPAGDTLEVITFDRASRNERPILWVLQLATQRK